jgi:transposase
VLAPEHLARFVVDIVSQLDLRPLYCPLWQPRSSPFAPEILLGLLFYGYATGVFASRKIEQATRETAAFRFLAGNYSPDHDTIATFRKQFLQELKDLFVQMLLLASDLYINSHPNVKESPWLSRSILPYDFGCQALRPILHTCRLADVPARCADMCLLKGFDHERNE